MSAHLKNFVVQYLNNQGSDHPGSYLFYTNKTPVIVNVADFKQLLPNNGTILMLHIIPNCKLHTISFQMAFYVAVCMVGPLNSTKIDFGRSTN